MKKEDNERLHDAVLMLMYYNGLWCDLLEIKNALKNTQDKTYGHVSFPKCLGDDCDHIANTFWAILVLMYGDYGTSPRFGWIEKEGVNDAIEFIDAILNDYKRNLPPWIKEVDNEEYKEYIERGLLTEDEEFGQDY